jgi:hypothetical protein
MIKSKILFIHKPKTAGVYVSNYFHSAMDCDLPLIYLDGWSYNNRDWNSVEIAKITNLDLVDCLSVVVHQHLNKLSEEQFYAFKDQGWFSFLFMREPEEIITSWYFFLNDMDETTPSYDSPSWKAAQSLSLDKFVQHLIEYDEVWSVKPFWEDIDWLGLPQDDHFEELFKVIGLPYEKAKRNNTSSNRGYYTYRESGEISDQTHELLISTDQYVLQHEIIKKIQNSPR